jgi:predicted nucleic acid-binding protein
LTPVVVDASVAVKWFVPEALSAAASRLLDGSFELWAPDLVVAEVGNTLWKKVGRAELAIADARDVLAAFARVPLTFVSSKSLIEAALEIATAHRRTIYDSLYVALAVARDCAFITADDRLVNAFAAGPLADRARPLSSFG